jgi:two-component system response regulator RegA
MSHARIAHPVVLPARRGKLLLALGSPDPLLLQTLEQLGVDVHVASTRDALAAAVAEWQPSCVVFDVDEASGPDIDLRLFDGADGHVKIALLASPAYLFSTLEACSSYGVDHVLMKPVRLEELLSVLDAPATDRRAPRLPSLERIQWEYINRVLGSCSGNVSEAARQLGMYRQSLQRMLRRHPPTR